MLIIWFQNGWDEQYVEAGGPGSPNFHKSNALKTMRKQPQLQGKLLAKGSWDYQLVDELVPQEGDIVLPKPRYSGFFNTPLDSILRSRGIRYLVFTGIVATNVCVESTLRDGFFLEYFGVVLEDATHQAGPEFAQKAALFNIETFFGWVSDVESFCHALSPRLCWFSQGENDAKTGDYSHWHHRADCPFVPGTLADGVVYVSGTLAFDQHNNVLFADDPKAQTRHVLETIRSVIETAGGTMADVTFNSIFITDWKNYAAINEIYAEFFRVINRRDSAFSADW